MVSGIHYNFQIDDNFMKSVANITNNDVVNVKNDIYMKLARQFLRYNGYLYTYMVPHHLLKINILQMERNLRLCEKLKNKQIWVC